ncbi:MAG: stage II sporulation protein M [Methanobacterium formicicum]
MKPIFSVIINMIITFILIAILNIISLVTSLNQDLIGLPTYAITILLGGITTSVSTRNKIRYSVYYGIGFAVIYGLMKGYSLNLLIIPLFAGMGGYIAKNDKDNIKYLINHKLRGNYREFFIKLFKRNKNVLIVSASIFFISAIVGIVGPYFSPSLNSYLTQLNNYTAIAKDFPISTTQLFLYNSAFLVLAYYIKGLFLGIFTITILIVTGMRYGFLIAKTPLVIFTYGIFSITSYILAGAAGFKLLITAINIIWEGIHIKRDKLILEQFDKVLDGNYLKFRDSITLITISIFLIFIASIIEISITVPLLN